jgi:hypothetical protein
MKQIKLWQKILALMVSVIVVITVFSAPAFGNQICYVKGYPVGTARKELKAAIYASPSLSSRVLGFALDGTEIRLIGTERDRAGSSQEWAKYRTSLPGSGGVAYIPFSSLQNCQTGSGATGNNCKDTYDRGYKQGYDQGYQAGLEAARRRLEQP